MNKKNYPIQGMHCSSCEILLEKELKKIPGVKKCSANHKKGVLTVESEVNIPLGTIEKAIEKCDLKLAKENNSQAEHKPKNTIEDYLEIVLVFIGVVILGAMFNELELARFFPNTSENVGIMMALALGVIASLSTCLVLVGGIVLSFGSMVASDSTKSFMQRAHPHIYFHIGRLATFFILGGLLGTLGSKITYSVSFTGYLTILVAVVMLYIGLQILNITPSITKLGFHLPKGLSKHVHSLQNCEHKWAPAIVGGLTFLLPCGFTQSMQLAAVASGGFWSGGLIMLAFALGTLPALFSIGLGSSFIKNRDFNLLKKIIGVVIILFGMYSLNSGMILSGTSNGFNPTSSSSVSSVTNSEDEQVVKMKVDWVFEPTQFTLKKGIPVRWEIEGVNVSGCTNEIIIPKLGISKKINKGLNVVEFTPTETGKLPFSCWMGMVSGQFNVID